MEDRYFRRTMNIGFISAALAACAWLCAHIHALEYQDTLLFNTGVPMAVFGIIGYLLIAVSALVVVLYADGAPVTKVVATTINHILVGFAGIFTFYLMFRSVQVGLGCPACWLCWCANAILARRLITRLTKPAQR